MKYDVIVIGAGLSGLTAASLLAKRGQHVAVIDKAYNPGGSCGTFKREGATFDQGSAMLYGFGEKGYNAHRFVFNCLEEPIDVIRHDILYTLVFNGHNIRFFADLDKFIEELGEVFPKEKENIRRFYKDMARMYQHVMMENPTYASADETDPKSVLKSIVRHPLSYMRFLSYLNISAETLLKKYFEGPEIFKFFDKLTSTYCYTTVKESPAVLAAVMFVDNHLGGSYYPAGSTVFLPGRLEKVIEEHGGEMYMEQEVVSIYFEGSKPAGVVLRSGEKLAGENMVYSGTVWNLYGKLINKEYTSEDRIRWGLSQIPTYPSVVLYALVDKEVIPSGTSAIEMLVGNPDRIDEAEVTVYISSIDDRTLCSSDCHVVMAIGPSMQDWHSLEDEQYKIRKELEKKRLYDVLERRFPGFTAAVRLYEVATPRTIEKYTNKNWGSVAGPKQMLGQHMFKRLHIRSEWDNLFFCGESTVMGTGTPTVTTSGLSAANAILMKLGLDKFVHREGIRDYVRVLKPPFWVDDLYSGYSAEDRDIMLKAGRCQFCEHPSCVNKEVADIRGIMRRVSVGNFFGARKLADMIIADSDNWEESCVENVRIGKPVAIREVLDYLARK